MKHVKKVLFCGIILSLSLTMFADNEDYSWGDASGMDFSNRSLKNSKWLSATIMAANFTNSDLTSADLSYSNSNDANFTRANLTSADLSGSILTGSDFTGANLTSARIGGSTLTSVNFTDAVITNANFSNSTNHGFTKEQLYSTASYKNKNLAGIKLGGNFMYGWDFSDQNLQNSFFQLSRIGNLNMSGADLRGADWLGFDEFDEIIYKNTIMAEGRIENFSMTSASDSFSIRKYEPASSGGSLISAKLDTSSTISGGATLALERGADFEITNNSFLAVDRGSTISINTNASSSTNFSVLAGSSLVFKSGAILEINLEGTFTADGSVSFVVFDWENGGSFEVIGDFVKDESIFLSLNGEKFNGDWNYNIDNNKFIINISQVPEPAAYAAIFGALALFIGIRRGKRN